MIDGGLEEKCTWGIAQLTEKLVTEGKILSIIFISWYIPISRTLPANPHCNSDESPATIQSQETICLLAKL